MDKDYYNSLNDDNPIFNDGSNKVIFDAQLINFNNCTVTNCKAMLFDEDINNPVGYLHEFYTYKKGLQNEQKYRYCNFKLNKIAKALENKCYINKY